MPIKDPYLSREEVLKIIDEYEQAISDHHRYIAELERLLEHEKEVRTFVAKEIHKRANAENEIKTDENEFFKCTVNGKLLTTGQLAAISEYFRACSEAEILERDYGVSHEDSLRMGKNIIIRIEENDDMYAEAYAKEIELKRKERVKQIKNTLSDMYGELMSVGTDEEIKDELQFLKDSLANFKSKGKQKGESI